MRQANHRPRSELDRSAVEDATARSRPLVHGYRVGSGAWIKGLDAITYAAEHGLTLHKHADPTEGACDGLSVSQAHAGAAQ